MLYQKNGRIMISPTRFLFVTNRDRKKIHSSVVGASEISSSSSSIEWSLHRAIWCGLPRRTAQWHALIYAAVWVHGYFLHGRGLLHAGRLPSITDSTFTNFAGIRARIHVASSMSNKSRATVFYLKFS